MKPLLQTILVLTSPIAWLAFPALLFSACGGGAAAEPPAETPAETANAAPQTFAEQVALGQTLYGKKCAQCHGASGEGAEGPRVVGLDQGALPLDPPATSKLRKSQFKTVADVAELVVKNMPPAAPGSLTTDEYFSILAFDLKANGIDLDKQKLDADLAQTLVIPR
jgi:cytochrome c